MWGLLALAPVYYGVRMTDTWSGRSAVDACRWLFDEGRANSIEYRLEMEDLFIAKARQRLIWGWGGWGRNHVFDGGRQITVVDGRWVLALGDQGLVGLIAMTTALLLPSAVFVQRFPPTQWGQPALVSAAGFAVLANIFVLDGLINAMPNILFVIAVGGLANAAWGRTRPEDETGAQPADQAAHYREAGRALKNEGRLREAKAAWLHALELLHSSQPERPGPVAVEQSWCDCANDLAWLLATTAEPCVRDPRLAVSLAGQATEAHPECGTYWNTLGVAQYCAGDLDATVTTLGHSLALNEGGTAFDFFFLAMAWAQLGHHEDARLWLDQAVIWMDRHAPGHPELLRFRAGAESLVGALLQT
jgi:tetratricopeptide (TPR) repeat protein